MEPSLLKCFDDVDVTNWLNFCWILLGGGWWVTLVSTRQIWILWIASLNSNWILETGETFMLSLLLSQLFFCSISFLNFLNLSLALALANVCLRIKQSSPDLFNTSGKTESDKIENQTTRDGSERTVPLFFSSPNLVKVHSNPDPSYTKVKAKVKIGKQDFRIECRLSTVHLMQ